MLTWSRRPRRWARPPAQTPQQVIQAGGVVLDLPRRRAQVDGYLVHLPAREAALLSLLLTHADQIVYRPALAAAAGNTNPTDHRDLDRLLHRLRRRIQPSPLSPTRLHRVGDTGYLFSPTTRRTATDR